MLKSLTLTQGQLVGTFGWGHTVDLTGAIAPVEEVVALPPTGSSAPLRPETPEPVPLVPEPPRLLPYPFQPVHPSEVAIRTQKSGGAASLPLQRAFHQTLNRLTR